MSFTLTDGEGNSITVKHHRTDEWPDLQQGQAQTAGGRVRTQTTGKRYVFKETPLRMEGEELSALMDFLSNGSSSYYLTYSDPPLTVPTTAWPLEVVVGPPEKTAFAWNGKTSYYFGITMRSVEVF